MCRLTFVRRVLIRLGAVVVVLVALIIALPFIQARRLSKQLSDDVATLRAREIPRVPPVEHPLHDNGFECVRELERRAPPEVAMFRMVAKGDDTGPWARGEQPIGTLPLEVRERLGRVLPWTAEFLACGSSRTLRVVDGLEPWGDPAESLRMSAVLKTTALEVRQLLAAGRSDEAAAICESLFEVVFDLTHVNLVSTMVASSNGRVLIAPCARALGQQLPQVRTTHAARWAALPSRFVSTAELLETERLNMAVTIFEPLTEGPQFTSSSPWTFYDGDSSFPVSAWHHYATLSTWRAWDVRMRALVNGDFSSPRELPGFLTSTLPEDLRSVSDYAPYVKRIDTFRKDFEVLVWLADGAHDAPPLGTRVDGGVELPADGGVWFLPIIEE